MKCLLISPPYIKTHILTRLYPPLSLLYLAANLKKFGHESITYDLGIFTFTNQDDDSEVLEVIFQKIHEYKPQLVGFTCVVSSAFPFIWSTATSIKERFPDVKTVIGGMHPTLFAKEILENCPSIDYIAIGESEVSLVKLCDILELEKTPFTLAPGMGQRTPNNEVIIAERLPFVKDIDELPIPRWQDVSISDYRWTEYYSTWHNPKKHKLDLVAPILTSRSCPFDCNFCVFSALMGRGFRYHSPKRVVDEVEMLHKQFGVNYFEFIDDNMGIKKSRLIDICNEIVKRKLDIQFTSLSGFHIPTLDREVIDALCTAGYLYAILPIEHGSDFIRNKIIGKNLSREKIFEVTNLFKEKGLMTRASFIIGFPEETEETLKETMQMIQEIDVDITKVFNLTPFPGTPVFQQCLKHDLFLKEVDINNLWKGEFVLDLVREGFYLKPFALSIERLIEYRQEIEALICWKQQQSQSKWNVG